MESHFSEEGLWASNMAARLRLIQAQFADDQPALRQTYLADEVERGLAAIPPSQRKTHLDALAERFPAWQAECPGQPEPAPATAVAQTPDELVVRLLEMAPQLSPEAMAEYARKLERAGFSTGMALPELAPELRNKLGLAPGQALNFERAIKLLSGLLEMVIGLDQLVWALWRQLARQPKIQKEQDFAKLAGPYLGGDPEVSTQLVAQPLEKTRRLIAALLGAVGRAAPAYAKRHASRFAPEVVEDWARMEKKWNETLEYASWRKYHEQYKEHGTEPAIENEIQDAIAKGAENLILGRAAI